MASDPDEIILQNDDTVDIVHHRLTVPLRLGTQGKEKKYIWKYLHSLNGHLVSRFDGVVLHIANVSIDTDRGSGRIIDDQPFTFWDVEADFYVIKPQLGSIMTAQVKSFSQKRILLNVYKKVQVLVALDQYTPERLNELGPYMRVGGEVKFRVIKLSASPKRPSLIGEIDDECMKLMNQEYYGYHKSSKSKKFTDEDVAQDEPKGDVEMIDNDND